MNKYTQSHKFGPLHLLDWVYSSFTNVNESFLSLFIFLLFLVLRQEFAQVCAA